MVPMAGVEPARLAPLPPQDSVSTNSTTSAIIIRFNQMQEHLKPVLQSPYYPRLEYQMPGHPDWPLLVAGVVVPPHRWV